MPGRLVCNAKDKKKTKQNKKNIQVESDIAKHKFV